VGLLVLLGLLGLSLVWGKFPLSLNQVLEALTTPQSGSPAAQVIWQLRLPRALLAALVGACLSLAGAALQALLRNPLADPYLTGTSAGASLGTALAIVLPFGLPPSLAAFLGALAAVHWVSWLAQSGRRLRLAEFLLAGVMVSNLLGALVSLLLTLSGQNLSRLVFFLLGNLSEASWATLTWSAVAFLLGLLLLLPCAYPLNLMSLGEEMALTTGVPAERIKRQTLLAASLLTGAAVSAAGLVGFVGLVIPHLCRGWVGADLRRLFPLTVVWGAALLVGCDLLARSLPQELPIGVITALLGAPWFLWQLKVLRAQAA
jgi:iron complex transport system permease protein